MREVLVLVADDNEDHRFLTTFALRKAAGPDLNLTVVGMPDGAQALDYLCARGAYSARRRPDLVLLDLSLPHADGFEVLSAMKADTSLAHVPVIVLTSSDRPEDVRRAYASGANSYVTKAHDLGPLVKYWTETVTLFGQA